MERKKGRLLPPEASPSIAEIVIPVPGLQPSSVEVQKEVFLEEGAQQEIRVTKEKYIPDNLDKKLPEVAEAIEKRPWLGRLIEDVHGGKKSAIFKVALGALVVVAAVGAGYEFGIKGGRDIRELQNRIKGIKNLMHRRKGSETNR